MPRAVLVLLRKPRLLVSRLRTAITVALLLAFALPSLAQQTNEDPLIVGSFRAPASNFSVLEEDGTRSGFFLSLAKEISSEIGVPIEWRDYETIAELIGAQLQGETDMIAGIARLDEIAPDQVYSDPVGLGESRLMVRADQAARIASVGFEGQRIGYVPPLLSATERALMAQNTPVIFDETRSALVALLLGDLDAFLAPGSVSFDLVRRAGLDTTVIFKGGSIREFDRVVMLNPRRADLMPQINSAIARMEEDGRLPDLRTRYFVDVPPLPPEVLTVAVAHNPPNMIVGEDGSISGFTVEIFRDLAELAAVEFEFQVVPLPDYIAGPGTSGYDLGPAMGINADRRTRMDFLQPLRAITASIVTRAGEADGISSLDDLDGLRVGVVDNTRPEAFVRGNAGLTPVVVPTTNELLSALLDGEADAILTGTDPMRNLAGARGVLDDIEFVSPAYERTKISHALRFGLGETRERLNAVIPAYVVSDRYEALLEQYFGTPSFWTPERQRLAGAAGGALALFIIAGSIFMRQRRQRQRREFERNIAALEREKKHASELGRLVTELERSNRELDEFAYIASHDLKEPLRGIAINANFMMREELPEPARERAARMTELSGRMERLISDLLFFSRLGRGDAKIDAVDIGSIIDQIRSDLAESLQEQNGEIVVVSQLPKVLVAETKLKILFQNLVVNGVKYNRSDPKRVEVGFAKNIKVNGQILTNAFYVRDNGIGIAEENRPKIFRIFSRLNPESEFGRGTGSGLAFARKIAESQGGVLDYTSQAGKGSTFYVTLPLADDSR